MLCFVYFINKHPTCSSDLAPCDLRVRLARRETTFSSPVKYFTDRFKARCFFCGSFMLFLSCFCYLFIHALWTPAGKGQTSWLSFVMFNCEVVTFPLVPWVRCGSLLYRFLIFALFFFYFVLVPAVEKILTGH